MKMEELLPLKVYPFTLSWYGYCIYLVIRQGLSFQNYHKCV